MTDSVITMGDDCTLFLGDCLDVLKTLPSDSVDAIVTDPPAGIGFMGKDWDHHKGGRKQWIAWMTEIASECLRVLKPGGHALIWAIPRTSHWTATAWEDAGFEIRDRIAHVFGSGFPKSADVSKMIDKLHGEEREVVSIVNPTELMRYLCRLITPPGGILIDPFMGSGSTGKASMLEGFRFIGIEREPDYFAIAEARIRTAQQRAFDARRQQVIDLEPAPEKPVSQPAIQPALPLEAAA